ncbi:MAG: hypothetical protein ACK55I_30425, partial [bacterium]
DHPTADHQIVCRHARASALSSSQRPRRLLRRMASQRATSWCPSRAVANRTGVLRPLAMCS